MQAYRSRARSSGLAPAFVHARREAVAQPADPMRATTSNETSTRRIRICDSVPAFEAAADRRPRTGESLDDADARPQPAAASAGPDGRGIDIYAQRGGQYGF